MKVWMGKDHVFICPDFPPDCLDTGVWQIRLDLTELPRLLSYLSVFSMIAQAERVDPKTDPAATFVSMIPTTVY